MLRKYTDVDVFKELYLVDAMDRDIELEQRGKARFAETDTHVSFASLKIVRANDLCYYVS